ncbi:TM2 domain-containing protein [Microbacterium sp. LWH11-1.2]|uniref:TM2 domain-containing protein n=1 Tax=Microbacterium sp. LWH11-1.2 TaxID=3135258 RepID=UPI00313907A0
MTFPGSPPEAGWYLNAYGQKQWWDGASWGPVAAGAAPAVAPAPVVITLVKTRTAAYWLVILLGTLGAHRFYLRSYGIGWMLLALWIVSFLFHVDPDSRSLIIGNVIFAFLIIWVLSDLFVIPSMVDKVNKESTRQS